MKLDNIVCSMCKKTIQPTGLHQKYCAKCRILSIREHQKKAKLKAKSKLLESFSDIK